MPISKRRKANAVDPGQEALWDNGFQAPETSSGEKALSVRDLLKAFPGSSVVAFHRRPRLSERRNLTSERDTRNGS
jgi:hypothetical protein